MNWIKYILLSTLFTFSLTALAEESKGVEVEDKIDVKSIIFGHINDAYQWHITEIGGRNIHIPLPIIVRGNTGEWHCFLSSKLEPTGSYEGFYIAASGEYVDKLVEQNAAGEEIRPLDLSITKNVCSLILSTLLLVGIVLAVANWYKRRTPETASPKGFVAAFEMLTLMIQDDVIKSCVGKDYRRYSPYLLTVFYFILINNVMGLIPLFPGGADVSGNIAFTLVPALFTFLIVNLFATREYWKEIFWPNVPLLLKVPVPILPVIEIFGVFTKPFALMIRLFANMIAGHAAILGMASIIFVTVSMGTALNSSMTVVSVLFNVFMNLLELLVAFIQAYVFTMLSAVFIGLSRVERQHEN